MYRCIKSFAGNKVSMKKGDTIEHLDQELAEDYKRAGFIVEEVVKPVETKIKDVIKDVVSKKDTTKKNNKKK